MTSIIIHSSRSSKTGVYDFFAPMIIDWVEAVTLLSFCLMHPANSFERKVSEWN
jgi:hypothetical protein